MVNKQDYLNAINQNIDMVRGDTLAFNFVLGGLGRLEEYNALSITFAVAEHYEEAIIFQSTKGDGISLEKYNIDKDQAVFSVFVAPRKTESLDTGRYYYDLQIKTNSNTLTLMRGILTLLYDVTN